MASLAFGHLTEPIWLGLLSVALPDLAAAIANLFLLETFSPGVGTIEIWNNWSCGFENSLQRGKGRRISAGCHLLEEMGEGGRHFKLAGREIFQTSGVKCTQLYGAVVGSLGPSWQAAGGKVVSQVEGAQAQSEQRVGRANCGSRVDARRNQPDLGSDAR